MHGVSVDAEHLLRERGQQKKRTQSTVQSQSKQSQFKCSMCDTSFQQKLALSNHEKVEHAIPEQRVSFYKCSVCDKKFSRQNLLRDHESTHQGIRSHKCHLCSAAYPYKSNLRRHIRVKHENNPRPSSTKTTSNGKPKKYICELCGKVMRSRYAWNCHKQRHTGKRTFQCLSCEARFFEGSNLRNHMKNKHQVTKFHITKEHKVTEQSVNDEQLENYLFQ